MGLGVRLSATATAPYHIVTKHFMQFWIKGKIIVMFAIFSRFMPLQYPTDESLHGVRG